MGRRSNPSSSHRLMVLTVAYIAACPLHTWGEQQERRNQFHHHHNPLQFSGVDEMFESSSSGLSSSSQLSSRQSKKWTERPKLTLALDPPISPSDTNHLTLFDEDIKQHILSSSSPSLWFRSGERRAMSTQERPGRLSARSDRRGKRRLPHKHHSGHSGSSGYIGCLNMTTEQLSEAWIFPGQMPNCSYVHYPWAECDTYYDFDNCQAGSPARGEGGSGGGGDDGTNVNNGNWYGGGGGNGSGDSEDESGRSYNPINDFDISTCETYENLWMWDLALSCEDTDTLYGCNCAFAEKLKEMGKIVCPEYGGKGCPQSCPICDSCLELIGCEQVHATGGIGLEMVRNYAVYVLAAAAGLLIAGVVLYFTSKRRKKQDGGSNMRAHLMDIRETPTAGVPLAPTGVTAQSGVASTGLYGGGDKGAVWLAPIT